MIVIDEILNPFNLFQVYSFVIWYLTRYIVYALTILLITIMTIIYDLYDIMNNLQYLKQMLQQNGQIQKLLKIDDNANYVWEMCQIVDLLPGDIINIRNTGTVPADCILLKGQIVVNESMLTGESVPLTKYSLPNDHSQFQKDNQNMLYYGCEMVKL